MAVNKEPIRWREPEPVEVPQELLEFFDGDELFSGLLVKRDIRSTAAALAFLYPEHYTQSDPNDLPGMQAAVEIVMEHITAGNLIGVWGDFDADGQTATAIMYAGLKRLTPHVLFQIPIRNENSHGISIEGIRRFAALGVKLLITCDTGISEIEAVAEAGLLGITTIVTDHHSMPEKLPDAAAVVNSQMLPPSHPMRSLSGAGVAYKFIEAVYRRNDIEPEAAQFLDLAAIGIVADLVPLTGEARYIVQKGLQALQQTQRPGLVALCERARVNLTCLTEDSISYAIAPRLNALSRMGDANPMIDLLTTADEQEAKRLVDQMEESNMQRRQLTDSITSAVNDFLQQNREILEQPVIVIQNDEWPSGVTGVVASHIADVYHKPAVIISTPAGKNARGSARSVEGFNIIQVLTDNQQFLIRFGGHPQAAGFAIEQEQIPAFVRNLQKSAAVLMSQGYVDHDLIIDAYVPLDVASNPEFIEKLNLFRPFGPENPAMIFAASRLKLLNANRFGREMNHRRLEVLSPTGSKFNLVWWHGASEPLPAEILDIAYQVSKSTFQGGNRVQVSFVAARPFEEQKSFRFAARPAATVIDRRDVSKPVAEVIMLLSKDDAVVFAEGMLNPPPGFTSINRLQVTQNDRLIILTPPAGIEVLKAVLAAVKPKEIIVFSSYPQLNSKIQVMKYLAEQMLKAVKNGQGMLDLQSLAAACGHKQKTIVKAVRFLASKTSLEIQPETENRFRVSNFGKPAAHDPAALRELDALLEETKAFRQYFLRTNLDTLFTNLEIEIKQKPGL